MIIYLFLFFSVPPERPEIFNETDDRVGGGALGKAAIIGPYNEGLTLLLYCTVGGGEFGGIFPMVQPKS